MLSFWQANDDLSELLEPYPTAKECYMEEIPQQQYAPENDEPFGFVL